MPQYLNTCDGRQRFALIWKWEKIWNIRSKQYRIFGGTWETKACANLQNQQSVYFSYLSYMYNTYYLHHNDTLGTLTNSSERNEQ